MKTEKVEYLSPDAVPESRRNSGITAAVRGLPSGMVGRFPLAAWDRPKMARNALAAASRCASRPLRIWMDDKYIYFADKEATS